MNEFLIWLSNNPIAIYSIIAILGLLILIIVILYLIAFIQGRDISFWPPKIGTKSETMVSIKLKSGNQSVVTLLDEYPQDIINSIGKASEVWMMGVTLSRTIDENYPLLQLKLSKGERIRVLLRDPNGQTLQIVSNYSYTPIQVEQVQQKTMLSLDRLCHLRKLFPNQIEIRVLDNPFVLGGFALEPNGEGTIFVEYYPFKMPQRNLPILVINSSNKFWYKFYREQFSVAWLSASEYECRNFKTNEQLSSQKVG